MTVELERNPRIELEDLERDWKALQKNEVYKGARGKLRGDLEQAEAMPKRWGTPPDDCLRYQGSSAAFSDALKAFEDYYERTRRELVDLINAQDARDLEEKKRKERGNEVHSIPGAGQPHRSSEAPLKF